MGQRVDTVHNHIVDSLKEAIAAEVSLVSLEEFDAKVEENTYFLKELATLLSEEPDIDFLEHRCEQEVYDYAEYAAKLDYYQYLFLKYREVALQKARREISAGVAAKFGGDGNINAAFFSLLANKIGDNDSLAKGVVKLSLEMGGVSEDFAEEIISGLSDEMISKRALKILNMEGSSVNSAVCQYIAGSGGIEFTAEKADKSEKPSYEDAIGLFDMHLKEAFYLEFLDLAIDVFGLSLLSSLEASLERNRAHLNRAKDGFLVKYFTLRQQVLIHYKNRGSGWADGYDRPTW